MTAEHGTSAGMGGGGVCVVLYAPPSRPRDFRAGRPRRAYTEGQKGTPP